MGQQVLDQDSAPSPHEVVFHGRYAGEIPGYVLTSVALAAAVVLGICPPLREQLGGAPIWVAWLVGGIALFLAWATYASARMVVKWVALSESGIRWLYQGRIYSRPWSELVEVERHVTHCYYNGQYSGDIHGAVARFKDGEGMPLSPSHMPAYEELISAIESRGRGIVRPAYAGALSAESRPNDRFGW
jgi:hypothetical protein